MTNFPHFDVKKSIIKKFFLAHQEKPGKYDLKNSFGNYYSSSKYLIAYYNLLPRMCEAAAGVQESPLRQFCQVPLPASLTVH